ncbi:hypothetical protein P5673_005193 [Acropora cervicornis]|uniref:P2X purinoreceptor 7 intracellular domain-containing protein n=1 Tax=Acropora cervicornis TaxID=6130 RepID=A0AAD9QZI6_ACRCE|nr:hypothetical protein P5673_005193 [Acropora cervicornis]
MSLSDSVSNENSSDESSSDEMQVVGIVQPYADEPLAHTSDEDEDDEEDQDGLTPAVLRARFEDEVTAKDWCTCGECAKENLTGALEYRCCKEIVQIRQKLTFDGSIEHLKCITKHSDFSAMTNRTVLLQVGPLLKRFLRAVAYRWLVRWSSGYMGWNNTRPLPACVYHILRQTFYSEMTRGYQSGQQREQ